MDQVLRRKLITSDERRIINILRKQGLVMGYVTTKTGRKFATKAERAAGQGFTCICGRNDLRVEVHAGSFHKKPDGTLHQL